MLREKYGHPDILVATDGPDLDVSWLAGYFDDAISGGTVFRDGETIQAGWSLLMLRETSEGDFELYEPIFTAMPIEWTRGVTTILRHLLLQDEVCRQLSVEPSYPSLLDPGAAFPPFAESSESFCMERGDLEDIGFQWTFFIDGDFDAKGYLCSYFEIALTHPSIIPFLALPPGALVQIEGRWVQVTLEDVTISSDTNEFLARLAGSDFFG